MKKFRHYWTVMIIAAGFFAVSCDDTDEVEVDPNDTTTVYDVTLQVSGKPANVVNVDYNVTSETGSTILARVNFTDGSGLKRLYITTDSLGLGEIPYAPFELTDDKPDGSVGLENSASSGFDFEFELPVPEIEGQGTYVYKFWATTGVGDFRDTNKRLGVGVGTITLVYGTKSNPDQALKVYEGVKLFAPTADGTSSTFASLLDGQVYKINEGSEKAALWDFGYFYRPETNLLASLASTSTYENTFVNSTGGTIVDVDGIAGTTELNNAYFANSTLTAEEFDEIELSSELTFDASAEQKVTQLAAGDVVEFVDNYGKKGLIKVVEVKGTFNQSDYILLDIKVQP